MSNAKINQTIVVFEGNVQGVGFRATVRHFAIEMGLSGSVQNLADGSVKVIVQGEKSQCEALISQLKKRFHITNAKLSYSLSENETEEFLIL